MTILPKSSSSSSPPSWSWSPKAAAATLAMLLFASPAAPVAAFVPATVRDSVGVGGQVGALRTPPPPPPALQRRGRRLLRLSASSPSATPSSTTRDINDDDPLDKFGVDFTKRASLGKLDPVIGRDDEIRRAIQILSRRTKNNPVLIGDPGVGECPFALVL